MTMNSETINNPSKDENLLEIVGVSKSFPGVKALDNVSFTIHRGDVHALVGENGAGKSTLMKIIAGEYHQDIGQLIFNGQEAVFHSPSDSAEWGIRLIHQNFPGQYRHPPRCLGFRLYSGRRPAAVRLQRRRYLPSRTGVVRSSRASGRSLSRSGKQRGRLQPGVV